MPGVEGGFAIKDDMSVDENIAAYVEQLTRIDADLAAVLAPKLTDWSQGVTPNTAELIAALVAATEPKAEGQ
jgi:hypothetical protein